MKSYLPFLWAGLWLMGSCSTPEPDPGTDVPQPGISVEYTLIPNPGISNDLMQINADATTLDLLPKDQTMPSSESPLQWHQNEKAFSMIVRETGCLAKAILYESGSGTLFQRVAAEGLDPCTIEIISLAHDGLTIYMLYASLASETEPERFWLRKLPMNGGTPVDLMLSEWPVDLDVIAGKLQVLTNAAGESPLSTIRTIDLQKLEEVGSVQIGYDAKMILRLGQDKVLVGFEDAHMLLSGVNMELIEQVRYQTGSEPELISNNPWASADGSMLYYTYPSINPDLPGDIGGVYEINRRTLVLYAFENFLNPEQREIQYDVGQATAIGSDPDNGFLLIGYENNSNPAKGGLLRLQLEPEFRLVDQLDLPAPPIAILSE